ncbi:MAG: transcriptional initiation protein Tat [Rothia mucilaginosa]|nr:transcriptional initiation protein Tat [Rothia mucilaginosa]
MIHSRRHFIALTGTAALGAMLAACGSKKTAEATASPTASASIAGAYDNLSGELKWTKYIAGNGAAPMSSTDPETGQVYTIEPTAGPASVDSKASAVPIPIEDESMYDKNARGLRATFAYFAAAVNYARMTGDPGPALQVVQAQNSTNRAALEKLRAFYAPGTNWLVGGEWTFRLTDKQPTTRGTKYAWACTVTQAHGMQVEKATNTTKPLEDTEAQEIKALYAEYDEEAKRWLVIAPQQYDPALTPKPTQTPRAHPSSTYTPTVTDDSTVAANAGAHTGANTSGNGTAQGTSQNGAAQNGGAQAPAAQNGSRQYTGSQNGGAQTGTGQGGAAQAPQPAATQAPAATAQPVATQPAAATVQPSAAPGAPDPGAAQPGAAGGDAAPAAGAQ